MAVEDVGHGSDWLEASPGTADSTRWPVAHCSSMFSSLARGDQKSSCHPLRAAEACVRPLCDCTPCRTSPTSVADVAAVPPGLPVRRASRRHPRRGPETTSLPSTLMGCSQWMTGHRARWRIQPTFHSLKASQRCGRQEGCSSGLVRAGTLQGRHVGLACHDHMEA